MGINTSSVIGIKCEDNPPVAGAKWKEKKKGDSLAVPPTQGTDFVGVVDCRGSDSGVFRSNDCTGCFDAVWGVLMHLGYRMDLREYA